MLQSGLLSLTTLKYPYYVSYLIMLHMVFCPMNVSWIPANFVQRWQTFRRRTLFSFVYSRFHYLCLWSTSVYHRFLFCFTVCTSFFLASVCIIVLFVFVLLSALISFNRYHCLCFIFVSVSLFLASVYHSLGARTQRYVGLSISRSIRRLVGSPLLFRHILRNCSCRNATSVAVYPALFLSKPSL